MLSVLVETMLHSMGVGYYILVYGIGVLAMLFSVASFQFKKRVTIIGLHSKGQFSKIRYTPFEIYRILRL